MALSEIIAVSIAAGTVSPSRRGFGIPLFLAYHTVWAGVAVRTYTSFAGVAADFASTSLPYKWAAAVFGQNPRPEKIKIGRLPAPASVHTTVLDFTDHVTGTAIAGSVTLPSGTATSIAVPWNTSIAGTLADLKTALDLLTGIGTCTLVSPVLTVPATNVGEMNHFSFSSAGGDVRDTTADWAYDTSLTAHAAVDGDFYGVEIDCNSPKNIDKVARWTLANQRLAFFAPQYTKPSQFATGEFTAGADYTALLANNSAIGIITRASRLSFLEGAWSGDGFAREPGSATWAFKPLDGVGADAFTATERAAIEVYKANHYTSEAGIAITRPGKAFGGEWIDVVIGLAWLTAAIETGLFALLVNNPKVPYTDAGFAMLVGEVRGALKQAEDRSILDSGWTVTILSVALQATADRAARIARSLEFSARLAGAVHKAIVNGTVTA